MLQLTGAGLLLPFGHSSIAHADEIDQNLHEGPFWLTIHCSGGYDPTLLCDPKGITDENDPAPINSYFTDEITEVGPFLVPPVEGHVDFFTRFQNDLHVINGIDTGTNSHETGTRTIWSGGMEANRPSLAALIAAAKSPRPSLAYLSTGGYDRTSDLVPVTRLPSTDTIQGLAYPERLTATDPESLFLHNSINSKITAARAARLDRLAAAARLPREMDAIDILQSVSSNNSELARLVDFLPSDISSDNLQRDVQVAMACFSAGVTISANLSIGGFDTHDNHDASHTPQLQSVLSAVAFAMDEAERLGIADKLYIIVGSDFARTPYYNDGNGKDHWPITSMMMMGPQIQGGRVVGATDPDQLALTVDPQSLEQSSSGIYITPGHVHAALRELAGILNDPITSGFSVEDLLPIMGSA